MGLESTFSAHIVHPVTNERIPYTVMGIAKDAPSSPTGNLSLDGGSSITVHCMCRWAELAHFCEALLGVNYVADDRLRRSAPLQCPIFGFYNCRASGVNFDGIAGIAWRDTDHTGETKLPIWNGTAPFYLDPAPEETGMLQIASHITAGNILYEFANVPVSFSPLPYRILGDELVDADKEWLRYTTVVRTPRVELLNVKGGTPFWIDNPPLANPIPVPTDLPIRVQSIDYVVTWYRVPFVITDLDAFVGFSNSVDGFLEGHPKVPTDGFKQDRMLLLGFREVDLPNPFTDSRDTDSKFLFNYEFFFQDKFNTHNNSLRRWMKKDGGGNDVLDKFDWCDFSMTGKLPKVSTPQKDLVIKQANLAQLFLARS